MIDNKDFVQLSEYCFNICEALKISIQGKNVEDLDRSVRMALEDSERYIHWRGPVSTPAKQSQGYTWNRTDAQGGGEHGTH